MGQCQQHTLRKFKMCTNEGGIATPLIVRWPGKIKDGGTITNQVGHVIDILPTFCEIAGIEIPGHYKGKKIIPSEGKSLVPIFHGKRREPHETISWYWSGNRAVRQGKWKLVSRHRDKRRRQPGRWELYDLQADRTELNNLAGAQPDKVKQLVALYDAWAERAGVQPWPVRRNVKKSKAK